MSNWLNAHIHDKEYFLRLGQETYDLMLSLSVFPRSLTGNGVRDTLKHISNIIPINTYEVKSGTKHFDWEVPNEWNLNYARITGPDGNVVVSTIINPLSIMHFSKAIDEIVSLEVLLEHVYFDSNRFNTTLYRTTYYNDAWGFCLPHSVVESLIPGKYRVEINVDFKPGHLTYGDILLNGKLKEEFLLSTYICHPSMANDNLSGMAFATILLRELSKINTNYTYRGVFAPETIGSVIYLNKHGEDLKKNIRGGLVITCVGDNGDTITYKKSRQDNSKVDLIVEHILKNSGIKNKIIDFCPFGGDERQYCSPAFNLPIGSLMRTYYYDFAQYHSSDDNMSMISINNLAQMFQVYIESLCLFDNNEKWIRTDGGTCEPQLGKRNLYSNLGGSSENHINAKNILWALNLIDGKNDLLAMANKMNCPMLELLNTIKILEDNDLITKI